MKKGNKLFFTGMFGILFIMLASAATAASDTQILTLNECIELALKQSPLIRSAEMDVEASRESLRGSKGALFPRIDLNAAYMKENQPLPYIPAQSMKIPAKFSDEVYSWNIYLRMPVYEGGRLTKQVDVSELEKNIQASRTTFTAQDVVANVTNAFNKLLQLKELRKANIKAVEAIERQRGNTELLFKTGRAANVELLRVNVQLAGEQQNLIKTGEAMSRTKDLLAFFMGMDVHEISDISGTLSPEETIKEQDASSLVKLRPDVIALSLKVEQSGKRIGIAGARRYPAIALVGNYGNRAGAEMHDREEVWEAGAVVSLNIFDAGIISSEVRREQALQKKAEEELRLAELKAKTEIENALSSFREARQRLEVAEKALSQSEEALRIEELKYKTGAGAITDVLLAQAAMSLSQANYYQALYDRLSAVTEYKRATGTIEVKR
jgi:outer membrane protein TolC